MKKEIKILLVEDVPDDIRFAEIQLTKIFGTACILHVADFFSKAVQQLQKNDFDVILLDLSLPDSKGLTNFKKLVHSYKIPVIIYTGLADESIRSEAMKFGAMDYLIKGKINNDTLKKSILNSILQYPLNEPG